MTILGGECSGIIPELFIMFSLNPDLFIHVHNRFRDTELFQFHKRHAQTLGTTFLYFLGDKETPRYV